MQGVDCPLCTTFIPYLAKVCTGCHGFVVYGATRAQLNQAFLNGFSITFLICAAVAAYFGLLKTNAAFLIIILSVGAGLIFRTRAGISKADEVQVFLRR